MTKGNKMSPTSAVKGASPAAPPPAQQPPPQRQQQPPAQRQQQPQQQPPRAAQPSSSGGGGRVQMEIPGKKAGLIIGAGGATINKLKKDCNVKMHIEQESRDTNVPFKVLHIEGDPKNVAEAKKRVLDIIGDQGQQSQQRQPPQQAQQSQQRQPPPSKPAWGGAAQAQPSSGRGQSPAGRSGAPPAQLQGPPPSKPAWGGAAQAQPSSGRGQSPAGRGGAPPAQLQGPPPSRGGAPQKADRPQKPPPSAAPQPAQPAQPTPQQGRAPPGFSAPQPLSAAGSKEPSVERAASSSTSSSASSITQGVSQMGLGRKGSDYPAIKGLIPPKRVNGKRPQDPKQGRAMIVETNHLALDMANTKAIVFHYDVKVDPEKPFRFYRPALREMQRIHYPRNYPSFDGKKNLYSFHRLPFGQTLTDTVTINDPERDQTKEVKVTLTVAAEVDLSSIGEYLKNGTTARPPQDAIQALDIVLRQPAAARFSQVGRSYFSPPKGRIISLGDGMDLWYGFFQSAILGGRPYLNIDVAHKGFPAAVNCIEALKQFCRGDINPQQPVDDFAIRKLRGLVKGLKVVYEVPPHGHQKRTYKVLEMGDTPRNHRFTVQDRGEMNVEKYFMETYNYRIRYPNVPCLKCGSPTNPIALPPELCRILEGQVVLKKLNEEQTRNMVKQAATPADYRRQKILDSMTMVNFNTDPHIKEFGITVGSAFETVNARVLESPSIAYNDRSVPVRKGVWNSSAFIRPGNLDNWVIYVCERRTRSQEVDNLEKELQNIGRTLGMNVSQAQKMNVKNDNPREVENDFSSFRKRNVQLLFVILPDRGNITYAKIKQIAELNIGVLTQCLKYRTISRLSSATVTNILLKVNAKVNGINHYIGRSPGNGWPKFLERPVMVVGADVTHPSPDQTSIPSVAAVAASHDAKAFHYNMKWRLQQPRQEMIQELEDIMKEQLMLFYQQTRYKPEHILFYRDGVSEGQFSQVLDIELQAVRRACKSMGADYDPPITFLVVQKRHHTRFFPTNPRDEDGRNKNVPAGTIVDTKITHKHEMDFYLVSHASIQGTSRPTKYHVLWDDANMSEQVLEEITYYLCHMFTRCTRSVSYPAPTYYAHLAAFRIRSYIENQQITLNNLVREQAQRTIKPEIMERCPMFFV